jgi:CubicO group peptidase (beta-lactamase class C family)
MNAIAGGAVNRALAACLFCFLAQQLDAATDADRAKQVDAVFATFQSNGAPGEAVLVIKHGHKVYERVAGVTDLRTLHPIDAHTNFRLASCSKQFTAMSIMLLVHDGKLKYEDHLTDIFPGFPSYGKTITIRNLLNHTSGLLDYEDLMAPQDNVPEEKLHQIQDAGVLELLMKQKTTKFAPGTRWDYSNSGYVVLGLVVAKVSGKSFGQFLHDRIFAPLEMSGTLAYEKGKNEVSSRAYGHTPGARGWRQTDQSSTSATLGDGGVYSSVEDLAKWDKALREHALLSQAEMQPAMTPVKVPDNSVKGPDGGAAEYGFGWFLNPYHGHARMWHYGETVGFRTNIQRFVDHNLTIIVLSNREDVNPGEFALRVADVYLERDGRD